MKKFIKTIFLALLLGLFVSNSAHAKIYAVLVGVSEYRQSYNNLQFCAKDAMEMYNLLRLQTSTDNLKLLTNTDATVANITYHTRQLFEQSKPDDVVIFFFSGHGSPGEFNAHDGNLKFSVLRDVFKNTKARRKLIFADACYAGSLRTESPTISSNIYSNLGSNVLLFLSSRTDQTSREQSSLQNGVFTYYLLAGLKGGADTNKNRKITAKELFDFVNPQVKERTKNGQIPVMWGRFNKNMIIINWEQK